MSWPIASCSQFRKQLRDGHVKRVSHGSFPSPSPNWVSSWAGLRVLSPGRWRSLLLSHTQAQPKLTLPPVSDQVWPPEGFPGGSDSKESACSVGDPGSVSGLGRFPWRREWQPTPVFLPGESRGQRSLAGYSPWGHKESDTEWLTLSLFSWPPDHAPGDWGALALSFVPNSLDAVLLTPKNTLPERNSRK